MTEATRPRPSWSGHVAVGEVSTYVERHGSGPPLVLLHGAFGTVENCWGPLVPHLADRYEVILPEFQGHGRTPDVDRPLSYDALAADVRGLLDALGLDRVRLGGYSLGGGVALRFATEWPDRVDRLVVAGGAAYDTAVAQHPELTAGFEDPDPAMMDGTPWHDAYLAVAPDPAGWRTLVARTNELDRVGLRLPPERIEALRIPSLLVVGDADVVRLEHVVELFRLLGGGVAGDLVGLPRARLAVLPGTTHVGVMERVGWLAEMLRDFLGDDRDGASGDA